MKLRINFSFTKVLLYLRDSQNSTEQKQTQETQIGENRLMVSESLTVIDGAQYYTQKPLRLIENWKRNLI